jgi:hypothetical protein
MPHGNAGNACFHCQYRQWVFPEEYCDRIMLLTESEQLGWRARFDIHELDFTVFIGELSLNFFGKFLPRTDEQNNARHFHS